MDIERFKPNSLTQTEKRHLRESIGLPESAPVIGYVGRLTRDKGLYDLAEASTLLWSSGVDHKVLIVGGVEEKLGDPWATAGLAPDRLPIVVGQVADTAPYYQIMDVLALPTKREGFPNVVLEAGASGIPAVTTNATGARDSVIDGETGWIVKPGDSDALSVALQDALYNRERRLGMGASARDFVTTNFDQASIWRNLADYYGAGVLPPVTAELTGSSDSKVS